MTAGVVGTGGELAEAFDPAEELTPGLLARVRGVLEGLDRAADEPVWQLSDAEVEDALGLVAWISHRLSRLEAHLVADGLDRGLPKARGFGEVDWVTACESVHVPAPPPAHAARTIRIAAAQADPDLEDLVSHLDTGELSPTKADALIRFHTQAAPVADPVSLETAFHTLVEGARDSVFDETGRLHLDEHGDPVRWRGLTDRELKAAITRTGRLVRSAADLDHEADRARAARSLTSMPGPCGGTEYRLVLDPEGAATIDAALAALSEPRPGPDGTRDPRPAARRRADALLDLVTRAVSSPDGAPPTRTTAQVVVTTSYEDLTSAVRGAGTTLTGQVLPPETVRKLACDATIIPAVLGATGQPLDLGSPTRLFPPRLRRALWLRDQGCTWPGCTVPPQWCQAHHIVHWAHGGPTTLDNGALVCEGHHDHVHRHGYTATITPHGVVWHRP